MLRVLWCVPAMLLLTASTGSGGPVDGAKALPQVRIGARSFMEFNEKYQGGRRACVIALGDGNPPVDITITVYDTANQVVAEQTGNDHVAAMWYPPRDAPYKILVKNSGKEFNVMYIVFR